MVFSDPIFLIAFLPIVLAVGLTVGRYVHARFLLAVSLLFYFWSSGAIVFALIFSILFNWAWAAILNWKNRTWILAIGVTVNLLVLAYYKYAAFLANEVFSFAGFEYGGVFDNIVLPVGISFFTFQAVSYLIDVHRKDTSAERSPVTFGAYLSFFPQLIAGPIVRFRDVADQYHRPNIGIENLSAGTARFTHGLLKKVLIADGAGAIADSCFALPVSEYGAFSNWLGALAYTIQIYFDFSAYSDMAIGLGLIFGIRFNENFRHPYTASTITEFWRRWHISLSTWFRDYLYIPLGGNRHGTVTTYRNLIVVFAVTGLWHGAAWTFVVWGLFHGAFLIAERIVFGHRAGAQVSVRLRLIYMLPVVMIGWIIFRADDLPSAIEYIRHLVIPSSATGILPVSVAQSLTPLNLISILVGATSFFMSRQTSIGLFLEERADNVGYSIRLMYALIGLPIAIAFALSTDFSPFLYFRF